MWLSSTTKQSMPKSEKSSIFVLLSIDESSFNLSSALSMRFSICFIVCLEAFSSSAFLSNTSLSSASSCSMICCLIFAGAEISKN